MLDRGTFPEATVSLSMIRDYRCGQPSFGPGAGAGVGGSVGGEVSGSSAPTICDLRGPFAEASGNVGAGANVGGNVFTGRDRTGKAIVGGGVMLGVGMGGSASATMSNTFVTPFNASENCTCGYPLVEVLLAKREVLEQEMATQNTGLQIAKLGKIYVSCAAHGRSCGMAGHGYLSKRVSSHVSRSGLRVHSRYQAPKRLSLRHALRELLGAFSLVLLFSRGRGRGGPWSETK